MNNENIIFGTVFAAATVLAVVSAAITGNSYKPSSNNVEAKEYLPSIYAEDPEGVKLINSAFGVEFKNLTVEQQVYVESYLKDFRNKNYSGIQFDLEKLKELGLTEKVNYSEQVLPKFYYDDPEGVEIINNAFGVEWKNLTQVQQILTRDHYLKGIRQRDFFSVDFALQELKELGLTEKVKNNVKLPKIYYLNPDEIQSVEKILGINYNELKVADKINARFYLDCLRQKDFIGAGIYQKALQKNK